MREHNNKRECETEKESSMSNMFPSLATEKSSLQRKWRTINPLGLSSLEFSESHNMHAILLSPSDSRQPKKTKNLTRYPRGTDILEGRELHWLLLMKQGPLPDAGKGNRNVRQSRREERKGNMGAGEWNGDRTRRERLK